MNIEQLTTLAEKLKDEFPAETKELYESIDFLTSAFDTIYDSLAEKVNTLVKEQKLAQASDYLQDSQSILDCRALLLEYAALLEDEKILDEEIASIEEDEEKERRSIPDYEAYRVDNTVGHSLYEDFTYKKACGFNFCAQYVEVANMKWVLVETCGLLAQLDPQKMQSLLTDKSMKGRKVSYFDTKAVVENNIVKTEKIPSTNIYIWTASSCNMTRNLIKKLLKKFNIPLNQFKIYLRADYSNLHQYKKEELEYIENIQIDDELNEGQWVDWDEDFVYTNMTITMINLCGNKMRTATIADAYKKILVALYQSDPVTFLSKNNLLVRKDKDKMFSSFEVTKGFFIELNLNSQQKMDNIQKLATLYQLDSKDICYLVNPKTKG